MPDMAHPRVEPWRGNRWLKCIFLHAIAVLQNFVGGVKAYQL